MRKQEQTRLAELAAEKAHHEAIQAQADIVSYHRSQSFLSFNVLNYLLLYFYVVVVQLYKRIIGSVLPLSLIRISSLNLHCIVLCWQERQRKLAEDQRNLIQQQAQAKAQMQRYEDELARKRMQVQTVK